MAEFRNILVVCIDRDNDLGRKTGIFGPVIGRKNNVNAAAKLAITDPGESDSNSIFGAVKKYDEVKKSVESVEVVTLTGESKTGFESDKRINEQLDVVLEKFSADAIILVSDGAEDDQVLPILQSRAKVMSKETIIVKQAKEVESTYYTIKEALKDPGLGTIVFGIPGLVLMAYATSFYLGMEKQFYQIISFVLGFYLILKGTGIEEKIAKSMYHFFSSISLQRTSFPFYMGVIAVAGFGILSAYNEFVFSLSTDLIVRVAESFSVVVMFLTISGISFMIGKSIDAIHLKKAYQLRRYVLTTVFITLIWFIIDTVKNVLVGKTDLNSFLISLLISFVVAFGAYKLTNVLDITKKITKLLIGLPVYSKDGKWIGKVEYVFNSNETLEYKDNKTKKLIKLQKKEFVLREGRILVLS